LIQGIAMSFFKWLQSFFPNRFDSYDSIKMTDDFAFAQELAPDLALIFQIPLMGANLDGIGWAKLELEYMSGYLRGYADVISQATGENPGSQRGLNLALHMSLVILESKLASDEAPSRNLCNKYAERLINCDQNSVKFQSGAVAGVSDANSYLTHTTDPKTKSILWGPMALIAHFEI
jgi:hypothetical protein